MLIVPALADILSMPVAQPADSPTERVQRFALGTAQSGLESRGTAMIRRLVLAIGLALAVYAAFGSTDAQAQERAYSRVWGGQYGRTDWERFYHYPYVWYPQNFWGNEYYRSSEDLYFRYPPEMRVPVYNKQWHNYYPEGRRYHQGHQFILDVF
jgi:hypothetical protein